VLMPMNRHSFALLPALDRAQVPPHERSDVLP
jgi:hypothetical protein